MRRLLNDSDCDWRVLGETDPYFAVLSSPEYHGQLPEELRTEFFRSGERHIDQIFSIIRERLNPMFAPKTALDFGCGVGRVLIPLAARCSEVTGVDISPAMLDEASRNCDAAGATNVRLLPSDDELSNLQQEYDFVHCYIVLQHIPVQRGERIVRALASRLAPDAIAMIHVTYSRVHRSVVNQALYWARTRLPGAHVALNLAMGRPARSALMQINRYSITRLLDILSREGCSEVHVRFSDHGSNRGVLMFARKGGTSTFA